MAHCTPHRVGEASATELGTQNDPGKAPVRAQWKLFSVFEVIILFCFIAHPIVMIKCVH